MTLDNNTLLDLKVFSNMARGTMFMRLREKAHIWGMSWRTEGYTDTQNLGRLNRAVDDLVAALIIARQPDASGSKLSDPWLRAADVANQAFMLADPLRKD